MVIIFALYSFWIPQIIYSAYSGGRKPLEPLYVIGMSLSRLIFPLYVFACPNNVYHVLTDKPTLSSTATFSLLFWTALQVAILLLQVNPFPPFAETIFVGLLGSKILRTITISTRQVQLFSPGISSNKL